MRRLADEHLTQPAAPATTLRRWRVRVDGRVQGVGFRPWIHRLAVAEGLTGCVGNDGRGAWVEVQGPLASLRRWHQSLPDRSPPSVRIEGLEVEAVSVRASERGFRIAASRGGTVRSSALAPDGWVCEACLDEVGDPKQRRYHYPFTNCTACGPRYTITKSLPYDRSTTTMAGFAMCAGCLAEYQDIADRRYHAQPIACADCGPRVWLEFAGRPAPVQPTEPDPDPAAALFQAADLLRVGAVVAIKGVGGFHLACDATRDRPVAALRARKRRSAKPLAVMVRDLSVAHAVAELSAADCELLTSPAAPIVLAPRRPGVHLSELIAPGVADVGLMLPYSPLHYLLMERSPEAIVMTSGNHPAEPICTDNDDARDRLPADAWLMHDRPIHVACDDSVIRSDRLGPIFVRRARGHVPGCLNASFLPDAEVIALGAELKATVATLQGGCLTVGRHLGDLDNPRAEAAFAAEVERMVAFAQFTPQTLACDLHPALFTTMWAEDHRRGRQLARIQHHHAHMAAVMVEHGVSPDRDVTALVLDGVGHGLDGTVWGGEVLTGGYAHFQRFAHLRPVPLPGGDSAAREPLRMATALLWDGGFAWADLLGDEVDPIAAICENRQLSPLTSSAGRLIDGVAALLGLSREQQQYEAQAAMALETAADPACRDAYPLHRVGPQLDTRPMVAALLTDGASLGRRAARFHNGLADGLVKAAVSAGNDTVVLAGGCMVNRLLAQRLVEGLTGAGMRVLRARQLPPGDGAISAGQAAVAACRGLEPTGDVEARDVSGSADAGPVD